MPAQPPDKTCASCGRRIEWRKKWARSWDEVKYCGSACRSRKVRPVDEQLSETIQSLLASRAAGATICPSEAARAVAAGSGAGSGAGSDADPEAWRELMEPARRAARRLVEAGEVEITQGGKVVDPSTAKGPIRVRRVR
ncbi:DUF2256 and DUF3253 domain-containing protein [Nocardioides psychrotolerans]|uniref:DUF2256 and DUF3253 domain-containing protein n=1 Tax=Nocardioides psychrotolerans TaxID=1005945 RepID=UPI00313844EB